LDNNFFAKLTLKIQYLHDRWHDENEYESFADYVDAAKRHVEEAGGTFVSLKNNPFCLRFKINGNEVEILCEGRLCKCMVYEEKK
jgi:hypothetical protein